MTCTWLYLEAPLSPIVLSVHPKSLIMPRLGCMVHGWSRVKALAGPGKLWTLARVPRRYSPALLRVSPRDENMGSGQARTCQAQDTSRFGTQLGLSNII